MDTKKIKETEIIDDAILNSVIGGSGDYKHGNIVTYKYLDRFDPYSGVTIETGKIVGFENAQIKHKNFYYEQRLLLCFFIRSR